LNPFVIFSTGVIQKAEMPLNDFLEKLNKYFIVPLTPLPGTRQGIL